jgi:hypothetical protein
MRASRGSFQRRWQIAMRSPILTRGAPAGMHRSARAMPGERRRAMLRTKSKNDPNVRGRAGEDKTFEGKKVKPVLYVGTAVGHGRYIAAQDESGKLIMGRDGRPIAFRDI